MLNTMKRSTLKMVKKLSVKKFCYTMRDRERVSLGKVKYNNLTGKSELILLLSQFDPYMNKILGINNENYIDTLLSKKCFLLKLTNSQPQIIHLTVSQLTYCFLGTLIKIW